MGRFNEGGAGVALTVSTSGNGDYVATGTSDEAPINNALNALTSGRTWKEKVILKGSFSIANPILIPSYTILEIQGIIAASADMAYMIGNVNQSTSDQQIEIRGGTVNGNSNLATGHVLIQLKNVTDGIVEDVYGENTYQGGASFGFYIWLCNNVDVRKCILNLCYGAGIELSCCSYCSINDCKAIDSGSTSAAFEVYGLSGTPTIGCRVVNCTVIYTGAVPINFGIELCSYSYYCAIIGGTIQMPLAPTGLQTACGINLGDATGDNCYDLTAVGVTIYGGHSSVILFTSHSACIGCTSRDASWYGIHSPSNDSPTHQTIIGNIINQTAYNVPAIQVYGNACIIQGNTLTGYGAGKGIDIYGNDIVVSENQIDGWCIGIDIESGATGTLALNNIIINGGCGASNNLVNSGTSTVARGNTGYNPQAAAAPSLPGTGVAFPLLPYDVNYVVTSATGITGLTLDGTAVAYATGTIIYVPAQHAIIPTYTGVPTFEILPI